MTSAQSDGIILGLLLGLMVSIIITVSSVGSSDGEGDGSGVGLHGSTAWWSVIRIFFPTRHWAVVDEMTA